jgi:acyl-CoA reductase-like NAD-dependent aldehyde dehydrogenase
VTFKNNNLKHESNAVVMDTRFAATKPHSWPESKVAMKVERFDVARVDECLDTLEAAFQAEMWKQLPEQERRRLVNRLYIILRDIGEGSTYLCLK